MNAPVELLAEALAMTLDHEPVPAAQVVEGAPTTGHASLGEHDGAAIGVWEHTPGVSTDVEDDEVFVVLTGHGRIDLEDAASTPIDLAPGSVVRLREGARTTWTVTDTLRKIYFS